MMGSMKMAAFLDDVLCSLIGIDSVGVRAQLQHQHISSFFLGRDMVTLMVYLILWYDKATV
jgi:hypothetical protein